MRQLPSASCALEPVASRHTHQFYSFRSALNTIDNRAKSFDMTIGILTSWKVKDAQKQVAERAKARSHEIDSQIKEDSKRFQRRCDILVMGSSVCSI